MVAIAFDTPSVLRQGTLTGLRWFAVGGQLAVLLTVRFVFGFELPIGPLLVVIAAGIFANLYASFSFTPATPLRPEELLAYLLFDTLQISAVLYLTGGVQNPFALWLVMQAMLAAAGLPVRMAAWVIGLVVLCLTVLALLHMPLPWRTADGFQVPQIYNLGLWIALVMGVVFTSAYAYRVARERVKLSAALAATQMALSREERLTALDGLAAAAAHELGTPLGTIQVTAKEMQNELPDGPLREDAALLISQTQRCQAILTRLSQSGQAGDAMHNVLSLDELLKEAAKPFLDDSSKRIVFHFDPESGSVPDHLRRRPEVIYGLRNLIENAHRYAAGEVRIAASWDDEDLKVTIADDGPGIPRDTMMRLGEPYPRAKARQGTQRGGQRGGKSGKAGLGLGFFIAKTLLERTSGALAYGNHEGRSGAWVRVTWPLVKLRGNATSFLEPQITKATAP